MSHLKRPIVFFPFQVRKGLHFGGVDQQAIISLLNYFLLFLKKKKCRGRRCSLLIIDDLGSFDSLRALPVMIITVKTMIS